MADAPRTIVVIPARMGARRLPGKPLASIAGDPMVVHVARRALAADCGRVLVAAAEEDIARAVRAAGLDAVLTRPDHASGTDRILEAVEAIDPGGHYRTVLNVQADLPTLDPSLPRAVCALLHEGHADIATAVSDISASQARDTPHVVKAVAGFAPGRDRTRVLWFTRAAAPWGEGPFYGHIGIYAYKRAALERFAALPPSPLEQRERLEQLRALEDGMRIDAVRVDAAPPGVDTPADLARVRTFLEGGAAPAGPAGQEAE